VLRKADILTCYGHISSVTKYDDRTEGLLEPVRFAHGGPLSSVR
jgi:hypothetical protein